MGVMVIGQENKRLSMLNELQKERSGELYHELLHKYKFKIMPLRRQKDRGLFRA